MESLNNENQQELKRKISLEENFMDHSKGNDIIYGFMLNQATFDPNTEQLYLTKNQYDKLRPFLKTLFCDKGITYIRDNVRKLVANGLIQEGYIDLPNIKHVSSYIFPKQNMKKYKLISNDMLFYVVMTRNACAVRIYTYLYNKYEWKQNTDQEDYEFTIKELQQALGWSASTKSCGELIDLILRSLSREGIIRYIDSYKRDNQGNLRPCKYLKFVAAHESQLSEVNEYAAYQKKLIQEIKMDK